MTGGGGDRRKLEPDIHTLRAGGLGWVGLALCLAWGAWGYFTAEDPDAVVDTVVPMITGTKPTSIAKALRDARVGHADALAALAVPATRIVPSRVVLDALPVGSSRFGGTADVPADFVWPMRAGRALTFLAQINLSDVKSTELLARGWLLFFYDVEQQPWGYKPEDLDGAAVRFVDVDVAQLVRREHPVVSDLARPSVPHTLAFTAEINMADPWDRLVEDIGQMSNQEADAYNAIADAVAGGNADGTYHHLLGHPQLIQNDMRGEAQLVANGIDCGGPEGYASPRAMELLRTAGRDWQLLLQLDSNEAGGWMWGDTGRIYFWIRRSDLEAARFDRVSLILQCG